jgi:hypothetical protein
MAAREEPLNVLLRKAPNPASGVKTPEEKNELNVGAEAPTP